MQPKQPLSGLTTHLSRRTALLAGLTLFVGAIWWRLPAPQDAATRRLRAFAERMIRVLGLHETPAPQQGPSSSGRLFSEAELTHTLDRLMRIDISSNPEVFALSDQSLRAHLRAMIINDYRTGAIVQSHGWWLSNTESLCLKLLRMR